MATINIPDDLKTQAEARAAEGGYASVEEYVAAVVRTDVASQADEELEALLLNRLDGGPSIPLSPELIEQFKREVRERRQKAPTPPRQRRRS